MRKETGDDLVVTGLGVLSGFGCSRDDFRRGLWSGETAIQAHETHRSGAPARFPFAGLPDFDRRFSDDFAMGPYRRWDPLARMVLWTAREALLDAGLWKNGTMAPIAEDRLGLVLGTGLGGLQSTELFFRKVVENGPQSANPSYFPETVPNASTGHLSIELGLRGPTTTVSQKQISCEAALAFSMNLLRNHQIDIAITGAVEDLTDWGENVHADCRALSPKGRLRPFDGDRDGTLLGEGGAIFIIERRDHAQRRRAPRTYGVVQPPVLGGLECATGAWPKSEKALQQAEIFTQKTLAKAGVDAKDLEWVSLCGLGSRSLDQFEGLQMERIVQNLVPLSALSGAVGAFACLSALRLAAGLIGFQENRVPKTIGLVNPENERIRFAQNSPPLGSGPVLVNTIADGGGIAQTVIFPSTQKVV